MWDRKETIQKQTPKEKEGGKGKAIHLFMYQRVNKSNIENKQNKKRYASIGIRAFNLIPLGLYEKARGGSEVPLRAGKDRTYECEQTGRKT